MAIYELDPVDRIVVAAVGEPGRRRFFPVATGSGRTLTLGCEKAQIQALLLRLHQMLEAQQIETPEEPAEASGGNAQPDEPEWQIGEMGLGYHEARQMFVLVASQAAGAEPAEPAEPAGRQEGPPGDHAAGVPSGASQAQGI